MVTKITVLLVVGVINIVESFGPKAGHYDIHIQQFEACEKQGSGKVAFGTRITNAGKRKYIYKENFTIGVPIDEDFTAQLEVQKWGNGGWRPKAIQQTFKGCDNLWKIVGDFFKSLLKSAGVTVEKCPVPAGPYDIGIEKIEQCENQGSRKINFSSRISYAGKGKYLYNENIDLGVPADDDLKGVVEVQKWGNGGWRPKFIQHTIRKCEEMWRMIGNEVLSIMKSSNSSVDRCPIPAGSYNVRNWTISVNIEKAIPVMEYGRYRGIMKWYYKDEFVGCIMGTMEMAPKASG